MLNQDNSVEFDLYEQMRCALSDYLLRRDVSEVDGQRVALYLTQTARVFAKLQFTLHQNEGAADADIAAALKNVLDAVDNLVKARSLIEAD